MAQPVLYQALKYDGSLNYQWQAQVEYERQNLLILYTPPNTPYSGKRSGVLQFPFRSYLWRDRWYNVNQTYRYDGGRGVRHYVNIGAPVKFDGQVVSHVDLDLDLDVDDQWNVRLLDEDEYAAHSARFNYPPHVKQNVAQAVDAAQAQIRARAWPFATSIESARLRIRPFFWSDLAVMDTWEGSYTPFDDPWLIPAPGSHERQEWYAHYIETPVTRLYAIETLGGQMIGHISLRDILLPAHARLGIGLAADQVSKGYGTEALCGFLDYYFDVLGFERMVLDVAATNVRAIRAYHRLGFRDVGDHFRSYGAEAQWRILDQPEYAALQKFFRRTPWGLHQQFYDMEMTRALWGAQRARNGEK